jgi:hypothetical protein
MIAMMFTLLGLVSFILSYVYVHLSFSRSVGDEMCVSVQRQVMCFIIAGERICQELRYRCFRSITRQEVGWFDGYPSGVSAERDTSCESENCQNEIRATMISEYCLTST